MEGKGSNQGRLKKETRKKEKSPTVFPGVPRSHPRGNKSEVREIRGEKKTTQRKNLEVY